MIKPRKHVQELDLITIVNRTYCFSIIKFMIDLFDGTVKFSYHGSLIFSIKCVYQILHVITVFISNLN